MEWLDTLNPPVPNTPQRYWGNVGNLIANSRFRSSIAQREPPPPLNWQPPITTRGGALANRGGPVGGNPN